MDYLTPTYFFDFESEEIQVIVSEFKDASLSQKEIAIALYTKVRDHWRYDPYNLSFDKEKYRASEIAKRSKGHWNECCAGWFESPSFGSQDSVSCEHPAGGSPNNDSLCRCSSQSFRAQTTQAASRRGVGGVSTKLLLLAPGLENCWK